MYTPVFRVIPAAPPSVWFNLVVLLHLLCVIGGFGYLGYNGIFLYLLRRRGAGGSVGALAANRDLSQLAELLVMGAFVFGVAAVGLSHEFNFGQVWVGAAMGLWALDIGILHGWIRPRQRRFVVVADQLATTETEAGATPPGLADLNRLERAISGGWGAFNIIVVAVVYLMVFKPGR